MWLNRVRWGIPGRLGAGVAIILVWVAAAGAAVIEETEIELVVDPNGETMTVRTRLHVADNTGEVFYGYALNPSTLDNLVLGQIRPESVYSSHLFYYPFPGVGTGRGRIAITVPEGWTGVSAGILQAKESREDGQRRFCYDVPYASGLLPYPLAVYPYVAEIAPFWPYAQWRELPITDPRVFPTLYFIKGALAIHALRAEIGDEPFFRGFRSVFTGSGDEPLTLDYFRRCFETAHGTSLEAFFHLWYHEPGLPEEGGSAPSVRRRVSVEG